MSSARLPMRSTPSHTESTGSVAIGIILAARRHDASRTHARRGQRPRALGQVTSVASTRGGSAMATAATTTKYVPGYTRPPLPPLSAHAELALFARVLHGLGY